MERGWEKVADAFGANFDEGKELGAAVAVYQGGKPVVDLWGGVADRTTGRAWDQDAIVLTFSTTKGMTALLANMLVERGQLDLDAPVAQYWPEFAANGKESIKVRWLLTHQAGLPALDATLSLDDICAWDPVIAAIEAQAPLWEPGAQHAYHALTFGHLVGEVIRRVTGLTPGQFFAEEIALPLGLSAWIGLPEELEPRVARLEPAPPIDNPAIQPLIDMLTGPGSLFERSVLGIPTDLVTSDGGYFGSRQMRAAEIPAGNLVTDARSLARAYAAAVGEEDGIRLLSDEAADAARTLQTSDSTPFGLPPGLEEFALGGGLGFAVSTELMPLLGPTSFGHGGAGGSMGAASPEHELGFGYVMNQMLTEMPGRPRNQLLMDAVVACQG